MSESRWATELFASSTDLREQANQPVQLTLVRRGVYVGTGDFFQSLGAVHEAHPELGDTRTFQQQVGNFVDKAIRTGRFPSASPAPPVELLTKGQMQAIRAYTLQSPAYFNSLNKLLNASQNAVFDTRLNPWQEFLFNLDTGLKTLQQHQQQGTGCSPRLFRGSWIPLDILEQHFNVGNLVVFKGCSSASTLVLEDFYLLGLSRPSEIEGKCFVVLEFDEAASREAVDIRFLSAIPQEEEWLFPPYLRVKVAADSPLEEFESSAKPRHSHPVRCLRLCGLQRFEPIAAVLDWKGGIRTGKLLELAILVAAHQEHDGGLTDTLLQLERCFRGTQDSFPQDLDAALFDYPRFHKAFQKPLDLGDQGWSFDAGAGLGLNAVALGWNVRFIEAMQCVEKLKTLEGEVRMAMGSPEDCFRQLERNLGQHKALLQAVMSGNREGKEVILSLACMLTEARFIGKQVFADVASNPFTCNRLQRGVDSEVWKQKLSEQQRRHARHFPTLFSGHTDISALFIHPVLAELEVGDEVSASREQWRGEKAAKGVLALLDRLRLALSRTRIVITVGPPDSGKTTILNRVFGLRREAGLGEHGRTKVLTLTPCPDMPDVLLADVPGFGNSEDALNHAFSLAQSLTAIEGLVQTVVVLKSGRHEQHPVDELLRYLRPPVLVVMTQADKRFLDLVQEPKPAGVKNRDWWQQKASEIKEEDARRIQNVFPTATATLYTCYAGPFSPYPSTESVSTNEDEEEAQVTVSIPEPLLAAFSANFQDVLVSPDDLRNRIFSEFRRAPAPERPSCCSVM